MNEHSQSLLIKNAFDAYHEGDQRKAESLLRQALVVNPADLDIRYASGELILC